MKRMMPQGRKYVFLLFFLQFFCPTSSSVRGINGPIAPTQPRFLFLLPSAQRGRETADGIFAKSTEITKLKKLVLFFGHSLCKNQKHTKEERTMNMSPIFTLLLVCQILDILSLRERKGGREDNVLLSPSPLFFCVVKERAFASSPFSGLEQFIPMMTKTMAATKIWRRRGKS